MNKTRTSEPVNEQTALRNGESDIVLQRFFIRRIMMKRSTKKILYVAGGTALAFAWVFTMPFQYLTTLRLGRGYLTFDDL